MTDNEPTMRLQCPIDRQLLPMKHKDIMSACQDKAAEGRDQKGRFGPGNPGRPKGTRHKVTVAAQKLLDKDSKALTRKAVSMALDGDTVALRLCLERICPPRKDSPITFTLPAMNSAEDAAQAAGAIIQAVAAGDLTPLEGASVMALVETFRRTLEASDFEARLAKLEDDLK